jgi:hypothetical protein
MLDIVTEKVCYIIIKAREFDEKVEATDPDSGSNPSDDGDVDILEDLADDPTLEELTGAIDSLNEDEQVTLLALAWLGRGDYDRADWNEAVAEAAGARDGNLTRYLVGIPQLGDYLEEGLAQHGLDCADTELAHL